MTGSSCEDSAAHGDAGGWDATATSLASGAEPVGDDDGLASLVHAPRAKTATNARVK
jgi:hypothetical protein